MKVLEIGPVGFSPTVYGSKVNTPENWHEKKTIISKDVSPIKIGDFPLPS